MLEGYVGSILGFYGGYQGIIEKKMESTLMDCIGLGDLVVSQYRGTPINIPRILYSLLLGPPKRVPLIL